MKKKEDINDYCTASQAAAILSAKLARPIAPHYIHTMAQSRKHSIRTAKFDATILYHKEDIASCSITQKAVATVA
jgi:hypothetical protein